LSTASLSAGSSSDPPFPRMLIERPLTGDRVQRWSILARECDLVLPLHWLWAAALAMGGPTGLRTTPDSFAPQRQVQTIGSIHSVTVVIRYDLRPMIAA
jgi:hypothetical protein